MASNTLCHLLAEETEYVSSCPFSVPSCLLLPRQRPCCRRLRPLAARLSASRRPGPARHGTARFTRRRREDSDSGGPSEPARTSRRYFMFNTAPGVARPAGVGGAGISRRPDVTRPIGGASDSLKSGQGWCSRWRWGTGHRPCNRLRPTDGRVEGHVEVTWRVTWRRATGRLTVGSGPRRARQCGHCATACVRESTLC
jgi:hypothetical protein